MKRRGFLKLFGKAAAAVTAAPVLAKVPEKKVILGTDMGKTGGDSKGGVITTGRHPKPLWPGLKKYYEKSHAGHELEFKDLFK